MESFNSYLDGWRTFYGIVAGSSATLMGLIFVSVSLHLDLFNRPKEREPSQIAWQTFINFFWVFTVGIIFLIPGLTPLSLGIVITFLGISGTLISSRRWWRARKHLSLGRALVAFMPLLVSYVSLTVSGLLTSTWSRSALIISAPVTIILIGISIHDAWNLLIGATDNAKG